MIFSKFDKLLVIGFVILLSIVLVAANIDTSKPYHTLQQIAIGVGASSNLSVDSDNDGIIDLANSSQKVFCNGAYNSFEDCLTAGPVESGVPSGTIVMWSGNPNNIPSGWKICDGTNGTPDLRGRFIVGYNPSNPDYDAIGDIGGAATVALTTAQLPAHSHYVDLTTNTTGAHTHSYTIGGSTTRTGSSDPQVRTTHSNTANTSSAGSHSHTVKGNTNNTGSGQAHENRPPYYTLAFIMKE